MTLAKASLHLLDGQTIRNSCLLEKHDSAPPATFGTTGIVLENQGVGRDVWRRMGKPVRWLRALLSGKARGRGHRQDLFHPCVLPAAGCPIMCLQGLSEPVRPGSRLCAPDAAAR